MAVFSGAVFSWFALGERRKWALFALAPTIGVGGYTFLLNAVAYFISVYIAFWLVMAVMFLCALVAFFVCRSRATNIFSKGEDLSRPELRILAIFTVSIMIVSGIVAIRTLALDDMGHMAFAVTISEGNFPVMDPMSPDHLLSYHYAPDLLSAALTTLTKVPPWLALDVQTTLFAGLTFLLAFLLAYEISRRFKPSLVAAFLLMYGGGLLWLHFIDGIGPLWHTYVLNESVTAPWKFLVPMTIPQIGTEFVYAMNNHSFAMGFPVMLFSFYSLFRALYGEENRRIIFTIASGVSFGFLALSLETNFVIIWVALICVLIGGFFIKKIPEKIRSFLPLLNGASVMRTVSATLILGTVIALIQGGIVSLSSHAGSSETYFKIAKQFWIIDFTSTHTVLFSPLFFVEFGLVFILFFPALYKFRYDPKISFLGIIAIGAFVAPLVVRYYPSTWEMSRLFGLSTPLMGFIVGLYLGGCLDSDVNKSSKHLAIAAILLCVSSGIVMQAADIIFPLGSIGKIHSPLIAVPAPPTSAEQLANNWIKSHTTLKDRFFPFGYDLMLQIGRFTPGSYRGWNTPADEVRAYNDLINSCSLDAVRKLKITYFYIFPNFPINNFEKKCSQELGLKLVYGSLTGGEERKIYKTTRDSL